MTIALYPGSFDPVTHGHLDIVCRVSRLFDKVVVGVYDLPAKHLLFDTEERISLFTEAVENLHLTNVTVMPYNGLTIAFARQIGAQVMVRGLRMASDFEHEFEMALMNKKIAPEVELVCLMASLEFQFLSSSLLKEVCQLKGNISSLVPPHVEVALREKFNI